VFGGAGRGREPIVALPAAGDAREETLELTFFLKAWQSRRSTAELQLEA
jgi:hypothetical protein